MASSTSSHVQFVKKYWVIILAVVLAIGLMLSLTVRLSPRDETRHKNDSKIEAPSLGSEGVPTTLTIYCDYLAPGCRTLNATLESIIKKYEYDVHFVFRQVPIESIHPGGTEMAKIAVASYTTGEFSTVNKILYDNQEILRSKSQGEQVQFIRRELLKAGVSDDVMNMYEHESIQQHVIKDLITWKEKGHSHVPIVELNDTEIENLTPDNISKLLATHIPRDPEHDKRICSSEVSRPGPNTAAKVTGEGVNKRTVQKVVNC